MELSLFKGMISSIFILFVTGVVLSRAEDTEETCRFGHWKCLNSSKCIPLSWKCDSIVDCGSDDHSDEQNCSKTCERDFTCNDGQCISSSWVCDGDHDCLDESDEAHCPDLPTAVAIAWESDPNAGNTVNLTCTATNGRPAPYIRWVINGVDFTNQAILEKNSITSSGYGNSVSNLPLALDTNMNGHLAICYVAYAGWDNAMNATLTLDINGSASLKMSGLVMTAIVAILAFM